MALKLLAVKPNLEYLLICSEENFAAQSSDGVSETNQASQILTARKRLDLFSLERIYPR